MRYCIRTVTWRFKESIELDLPAKRSITIRSPSDVFENYQSLFKDQVRERFVVFWLNSANRVVGFEVITEGLLNKQSSRLCLSLILFKKAVTLSFVALVLFSVMPTS